MAGQRARAQLDEDEKRRLEDSLVLIPRTVRDKLDRVGIKLHLDEWQMLSMDERTRLSDQRCDAEPWIGAYRAEVENLVRTRCGKSADRLEPPQSLP